MLDMELATRFGQENPHIYEEAFGPELDLPLNSMAILAITYARARLQEYQNGSASLLPLLEEAETGYNCKARFGMIQTLLGPEERFYPALAVFDMPGVSPDPNVRSVHFFNVINDIATGEQVIVDNGRYRSRYGSKGTLDLIVNPWDDSGSDPKIFGPIFETALAGAAYLEQHPLDIKIESKLKFLETPVVDGAVTSVRHHVKPDELPSEAEIKRQSIVQLEDTTVTVFSNEESTRIADIFTYGPVLATAAA